MINEEMTKKDLQCYGMRVRRIELLNWGGYDKAPAILEPNGESMLLTGENGVGKTTIMDAISTLLTKKPQFEQAVSTKKGEKNVASYLIGQFKQIKNDEKYGSTSIVAIRGKDKGKPVGIILCVFSDAYNNTFTAVQIISFIGEKIVNGKPGPTERKGFIINGDVSIQRDIACLSMPEAQRPKTASELARRIKEMPNATPFSSLEGFCNELAKRLNISKKGLESIANTTSLKNISNIDEFMKNNLDVIDLDEALENLLRESSHLEDVDNAIEENKKKISLLIPLVNEEGKEYEEQREKEEKAERLSKNFDNWLNRQEYELSKQALSEEEDNLEKTRKKIVSIDAKIQKEEIDRTQLIAEKALKGENKIKVCEQKIELLQEKRDTRVANKGKYEEAINAFPKGMPFDKTSFAENKETIKEELNKIEEEQTEKEEEITNLKNEYKEVSKQVEEIKEEIKFLKNNKGNIPRWLANVRDDIAKDLQVEKERLPFVGELLDVPKEESIWEGAINKLLFNFSIKVLVPSDLREQIPQIIERMSGIKIDYEQVEDCSAWGKSMIAEDCSYVSGKLSINENASMTKWVAEQIINRFKHKCCDTISDFNKESFALTQTGQHKEKSHGAKDDRKSVSDPKNYTLGFSNDRKIKELEKEEDQLLKRKLTISKQQVKAENERARIDKKKTYAQTILQCKKWEDIDTETVDEELSKEKEILKLLSSDQEYQNIEAKLNNLEKNIENDRTEKSKLTTGEQRSLDNIEKYKDAIQRTEQIILTEEEIKEINDFVLTEWTKKITLENLWEFSQKMREKINKRKDNMKVETRKVKENLNKAIRAYNTAYPTDNMGMDYSYLQEFKSKLTALEKETVERTKEYEQLFSKDLAQYFISFQKATTNGKDQIKEKIETLNDFLRQTPFRNENGKDLFMKLKYEETESKSIKDFQANLESATKRIRRSQDDAIKDIKHREAIRNIIKEIAESRAAAQENKTKILDIRKWFDYSVWLVYEDETQHSYYGSTSGNSTGRQKAMASFLFVVTRLQPFNHYDLIEENNGFRFLLMDETNENCDQKTGDNLLQCLKRFNFQTIFITPKQEKVNEISPYVGKIYQCQSVPEKGEGYSAIVEIAHTNSIKKDE